MELAGLAVITHILQQRDLRLREAISPREEGDFLMLSPESTYCGLTTHTWEWLISDLLLTSFRIRNCILTFFILIISYSEHGVDTVGIY